MIKIVHIISGLGSGGAENMLYKLLKYSDKGKFHHEVISLVDEGIMGDKIQNLGIKVHSLNLSINNLFKCLRLTKEICKEFDIVNTWLYHADLIGFIVGKILLRKKVIWNIRHSNLDKDSNKQLTLIIIKINALLSKYVNVITYNSNRAIDNHVDYGYAKNKSIMIPNGFELDKFKYNFDDGLKIRQELRLNHNDKVIITVGRWNIQKDYYTLFEALSKLIQKNINFKMIMVGTNLDHENQELNNLIKLHKLDQNLILLGRRTDVPALLSASDIYVSSSLGESFSNAIGEAMSCGLPCVVTDVGDSKLIVGETGLIVDPRNHHLLADALIKMLKNKDLEQLKKSRRSWIYDNFSISNIVEKYEELYFKEMG